MPDGTQMKREEAEKEYDELIDAIEKGIEDGYGGRDAQNEVLDIVAMKTGHESRFHSALNERTKQMGDFKKALEENIQVERRKKRANRNAGIYELIEMVNEEEEKKQQQSTYENIKSFVEAR